MFMALIVLEGTSAETAESKPTTLSTQRQSHYNFGSVAYLKEENLALLGFSFFLVNKDSTQKPGLSR